MIVLPTPVMGQSFIETIHLYLHPAMAKTILHQLLLIGFPVGWGDFRERNLDTCHVVHTKLLWDPKSTISLRKIVPLTLKLDTCQVAINYYWTPNPKFHFEMLLFRGPQQIVPLNNFGKLCR